MIFRLSIVDFETAYIDRLFSHDIYPVEVFRNSVRKQAQLPAAASTGGFPGIVMRSMVDFSSQIALYIVDFSPA